MDKSSSRRRPSRYGYDEEQRESEDEEEQPVSSITCWIPAENIDLTVLAAYLKEFIDNTASIRHSKKPNDPSKSGFTINARNTISVAGCRDIIEDSKSWEGERSTRSFKKEPYSFLESDTWEDRKRKGATPGFINPRAVRRRRGGAATTADQSRPSVQQSQSQGQGQGRHDREPSPQRPIGPRQPDPDTFQRGTKSGQPEIDAFSRLNIGDEPARANQKSRLAIPTTNTNTSRHNKDDDDTKQGTKRQDTTGKKDPRSDGRSDGRQTY